MTDQPTDPLQLELNAKIAGARANLVQTRADTAKLVDTLASHKASIRPFAASSSGTSPIDALRRLITRACWTWQMALLNWG
jgi:hypothetical protein